MDAIKELLQNNDLEQLILGWALQLLIAFAIFIIGRWTARAVTRTFRRLLEMRHVEATLVTFLGNLVYAVMLAAVVIAALDALGLPVTSLIAVLAAAGLAIGLALKDSLGNFAAGVMLVMFRPFTKGDVVQVAGVNGKVEEVGIFSTIIKTSDNTLIIIPNGQVAGDTITNFTALDTRRVSLVIGVGYDDDLKVVRSVLERICADHPLVLDDPEPGIALTNLGDSSVDFAVRAWTRTEDYWAVRSDLLESAKTELEASGCNIPYPQTDVHLHQPSKKELNTNGK